MRVLSAVLLAALASTSLAWADLTCFTNVSVTPTLRTWGRAESLGEITLVCFGGLPPGSLNLTVSLNTRLTSRAFTGVPPEATEALLLVNEPESGLDGAPPTQIACDSASALASTCPANTNVYQGVRTANNQVTFFGVGISSTFPGDLFVLRIVNLRADASLLGPALPANPVVAAIEVTPPLAISNATPTVGFVDSTGSVNSSLLMPDLLTPVPAGGIPLSQCVAVNAPLALDPASPAAPDGVSFVVRIKETVPTAFKNLSVNAVLPPDVNTRPPAEPQAGIAFIYNRETAFFNPAFPAINGLSMAGLASQATRIMVRFTSPPFGVQVHAPVYERGGGPLNSRVRLVASLPDGSSPTYSPLGPLSALNTYYTPSLIYVYEVTARAPVNPNANETIDLPFYLAHTGMPYVTTGLTGVNVTLAPVSTDGTPFAASIPRFADVSTTAAVANLTACAGTPALKAVISAVSGPSSARLWTLGLFNYGTASATAARVTSLTLVQTFGAACTPVVVTGFPVAVGTVAAGATGPAPVTINFTGCAAAARFQAIIGFAAAGGIGGTNTYANQFQ